MLKLVDIKKEYYAGGETVEALKGVSLNFRRNEFVSILGASGCGKTTLLNIIGGLDKYTTGDLVIDGTSTKKYNDRDWDTYRNHSVGFIFQSYHLIPHQTILQNVELALTIAGVSKEERRQRAIDALEKVGLKDKMKNRPNQLSGGQAQRVAIARALINDPEIVLADEPTGALDSKTSVQIMDLLSEISKDRLVIMVTHNPELAEQYSTRIIKLLDGLVIDDTMPYSSEDEAADVAEAQAKAAEALAAEMAENEAEVVSAETAEGAEQADAVEGKPKKKNKGKKKKSSMSFGMAFGLSLKNLLSKRKRTAMVSVAGSIGIIGVSMVLAISAGVKGYIKDMENDMLSGNPISIERSAFDMSAVMNINETLNKKPDITKLKDKVYVDSLLQTLLDMGDNFFSQNNISEYYIDYVSNMPAEYYAAMQFGYDFSTSNYIYTDFNMVSDTSPTEVPKEYDSSSSGISFTAIRSMYTSILGEEPKYSMYAGMIDMFTGLEEVPGDSEYILSQYDVVATNGNMSENDIKNVFNDKSAFIIVLEEGKVNELDLAQYGFFSQEELLNYALYAAGESSYDPEIGLPGSGLKDKDPYYDETLGGGGLERSFLFNKHFKFYPNNAVYSPTEDGKGYAYNSYSKDFSDEGSFDMQVKLILEKKSSISYGCLDSGMYYTNALTKHILDQGAKSKLADYMKANGNIAEISYTYEFTHYTNDDSGTRVYTKKTATDRFETTSMFGRPSYVVTKQMVAVSDLPSAVYIYPANFSAKDKVTGYLDDWNDLCASPDGKYNGMPLTENDQVTYTDMVGLIISMINMMIEMITIALVAFTALSLVVSTVMVGIITYVSVVERIKEIGILRSVGARKKDIKRLFNAETFMIGLASGVIGIVITYIVSLILNLSLKSLIGFAIAALPFWQAIIMIAVSVVLTLISGLIPAAAAAKKDPVVALRTE